MSSRIWPLRPAVLVVFMGILLIVQFGLSVHLAPRLAPAPLKKHGLSRCFQHDATHYRGIASEGYGYDEEARSNVAFFPLYPLICSTLMQVTELPVEWAMLLVANLAFMALVAVAWQYFHTACGPENPAAGWCWLLFLVWPFGLFLHVPYAESLFVLLGTLIWWGLRSNWPPFGLAVLVGLIAACRPVGVAFVPALAWHLGARWRRGEIGTLEGLTCVLVGSSGLLIYMAFLAGLSGDPLAFAWTQEHWRLIPTDYEPGRLLSLATLEPLWGPYEVASPRAWNRYEPNDWFLLNAMALNPIFWTLILMAVVWGAWRGLLTVPETLSSLALLLIPYATRGYEMSAASFGRFSLVVAPAFVVLGQGLWRLPVWVRLLVLLALLAWQSGLAAAFARGWVVF